MPKKRRNDDTISNETRASWAQAALIGYEQAKGDSEPAEELITNLLADLRHYCHQNDYHFEKLDNLAFQHYEQER